MIDSIELVGTVFSGLSALVIEDVEDAGEVICVRARTRDRAVACPGCGTETARVHEYRERTVADVPADGRRVLVKVRVRRMRCPVTDCKRAATTVERWQQVHELRARNVGLLECARRLNLSLNTVKRYDRASEPQRLQRVPKYRPTLVDPYRDHLRKRRAEEPGAAVRQLLREIRELGYQGSSNLLVRYINQGRAEGDRPHLSPRRATRILLTRPDRLTGGQAETLAELTAACPEMTALTTLITSFAALLVPDPGNDASLRQWITGARAAALPHLHSFTRGLDLDIQAAMAALTMPHRNGRTEGVNTKTKMIKRQMYGRAGFTLLRHRILLG
jgi:transposase